MGDARLFGRKKLQHFRGYAELAVRGEAWEYTEEVEENHISTADHRVRPNWMSAEQVAGYEAAMAKRDRELHPEARSG